jgi:hypothetical protein
MAAVFSLWETKSGNVIIAALGRAAVATFALARETSRCVKQIAEGDSLAERALAAAPSASLTGIAKPKPTRRPLPASPDVETRHVRRLPSVVARAKWLVGCLRAQPGFIEEAEQVVFWGYAYSGRGVLQPIGLRRVQGKHDGCPYWRCIAPALAARH